MPAEARITPIWKKQKLFVAIFLLAIAAWFYWDGEVGYPRSNERWLAQEEYEKSGRTTEWPAYAAWGGWISFVDTDNDEAFDTGEALLQANLLSGVSATASTNIGAFVTFQSDGLARRSNGNLLQGRVVLCIATTTPLLNARDVQFATGGGSLRVAKRNATVSCTAPN